MMPMLHIFILFLILEVNKISAVESQSEPGHSWMKLFSQCYNENVECRREKDQCQKDKESCQKDKESYIIRTGNEIKHLVSSYTLFNTTIVNHESKIDKLTEEKNSIKSSLLVLVAPLVSRDKIDGLRAEVYNERKLAAGWLKCLEKKHEQAQKTAKPTSDIPDDCKLSPEMENAAKKLQEAYIMLDKESAIIESKMDSVLSLYTVSETKKAWLKHRMQGNVGEWFLGFHISNNPSMKRLISETNCEIPLLSVHLAYLYEISSDDAHKLGSTLAQLYKFSDSQLVGAMMNKTHDKKNECLKQVLLHFYPDTDENT